MVTQNKAVDYDYVLFDLGGVLVKLTGVAAMQRLAGLDHEDEVWRRWLACEWVRRFERGLCSADDFGRGVVAEWDLPIGPAEFLEAFSAWPESMIDGADARRCGPQASGRGLAASATPTPCTGGSAWRPGVSGRCST